MNQFYSGRFPGTFARGLPFNYNPVNQDMRISGTYVSQAGLEAALAAGDAMAGETTSFKCGNAHVLDFMRHGQILFFGNISEHQQTVHREALAEEWA